MKPSITRIAGVSLPLMIVSTISHAKYYTVQVFNSKTPDALHVKKQASSKAEIFQHKQMAKLAKMSFQGTSIFCFRPNAANHSEKLVLNITKANENRTIELKKGNCKSLDTGWGSFGNVLASWKNKALTKVFGATGSELIVASYQPALHDTRSSTATTTTPNTTEKPFCPSNYSGTADIQPAHYPQFHVFFKEKYHGKRASIYKQNSKKPLQTTTITHSEAVFTDFTMTNADKFEVRIDDDASAKKITLIPYDIATVRTQVNSDVPYFNTKALQDADISPEFAEVLYDLNMLQNDRVMYFHLNALNSLYQKQAKLDEQVSAVVLAKLNEYKSTYCY